MKKWIVMLAMLSLLTACAQAAVPESAELTELSAATSESAKRRRNTCTDFTSRSDCRADSNPGTYRHTRVDTFGNTRRYPRADSCPYAGTHSSADGRTCPGADQHELWCRAL